MGGGPEAGLGRGYVDLGALGFINQKLDLRSLLPL